jgi:Fe2+ transport system protein FeoA
MPISRFVSKGLLIGAAVTVDALAHGPDDPLCCPTQQSALVYRYEEEGLIQVAEEMPAAG